MPLPQRVKVDNRGQAEPVPQLAVSQHETLIKLGSISSANSSRSYDVTPDGRRVFLIRTPGEQAPRRIDIVTDWLRELKRLVPVGRR